jgi:hypothetical protein
MISINIDDARTEVGVPEIYSPILLWYEHDWLPALHQVAGKCVIFMKDGSFKIHDLDINDSLIMYKQLEKITVRRND